MDNLPELRDIHLPSGDVSIFPLAIGWWLLPLIIGLLYLAYLLFKYVRVTSARIYANYLLKPLQNTPNLEAAVKMSEILRRVCVHKYPYAVSLCGIDWVEFLNEKSKEKMSKTVADLLVHAPYVAVEKSKYTADDVLQLWHFCRAWIGDNL